MGRSLSYKRGGLELNTGLVLPSRNERAIAVPQANPPTNLVYCGYVLPVYTDIGFLLFIFLFCCFFVTLGVILLCTRKYFTEDCKFLAL